MASFSRSSVIAGRRRKSSPHDDLSSMIASKRASHLRCESIGVIGSENSGRNTLVRRCLHMTEGPFIRAEDEKYNRRSILIELKDRPNLRHPEIVKLKIYILNGRTRSYQDVHCIVPHLKSIAMVYDVSWERTVNIAVSFVLRTRERMNRPFPPFIMIGNKIDLEVPDDVMSRNREQALICGPAAYYECSALANINMDPVLDAILIMTFFPDRPLPQ